MSDIKNMADRKHNPMKVKLTDLSDKQRIEILNALYTAVSSVKGRGAMKSFLQGLLTESERIMFGRRLLIRREIASGKSRRAIAEKFGVGLDTIGKAAQ